MRSLAVISSLLLTMLFTSCTQNNPEMTSPVEPQILGNSAGFEAECHANMSIIASQEIIYFAFNGKYTDNIEDLEMAGVVCPECGSAYLLSLYDEGEAFRIECPLQSDPNHGNIDNGVPSWVPGGGDPQLACRANMRTIASQSVIFFAENDRFPESLEELGMGDMVCPEHGDPYIYYLYDAEDHDSYFHLECGKPSDPNHGCIHDGVASWHDPEATAE